MNTRASRWSFDGRGIITVTLCVAFSGCSSLGRSPAGRPPCADPPNLRAQDAEDPKDSRQPPERAATEREREPFEVETGVYLSALLAHSTIGGDFNGDTMLVGFDEAILIPELDGGSGYGLALGQRWKYFGLELNYLQTGYDASVLGVDWGEADAYAINVDLKYFPVPKWRLQPYLLFGLGRAWIDVEDASFDAGGDFDDATFSGSCVNLGAGASYYFRRDLSLDFGLVYRWMKMNEASGIRGDEQTIDDPLEADGTRAVLGLTYTF